jgi:glucose-6-phosphate 1-dehydrogenase
MESMTFVLFGSTGDLAKRKIYPALYNLFIDQKMPRAISVIGLGRRELSDADFQARVKQSVEDFSRRKPADPIQMEEFLGSFRYHQLNVTDTEGYGNLLELVQKREKELNIPENRMFYLSVAPDFFDIISFNIQESGLGSTKGWRRLLIEKPFGRDLASARELNAKLSKTFNEEEIYRIDHYLGKPMIQNLEALEFANPVIQALWNNHYIANVQITASETVGVEERAGYYNQAGAIRDMIQNHMLQMVMMTAMHLPKQISSNEIREEKRKIMESLRPLKKRDVHLSVVRGQYSSGEIDGRQVPGYTNEHGVLDSSQTDTYIAARLMIDDPFWNGVPFYIRTGKRMKEKSTRIVVEFKNSQKGLYSSDQANLLEISIAPNERISLQLNSKSPGRGSELQPINLGYTSDVKDIPEAYELLIFDALRGDSTFFAHWDEVELSWQWVQPVLEAFEENLLPLYPYEAGSNGPQAASLLLEQDGFKWRMDKESPKPLEQVLQR